MALLSKDELLDRVVDAVRLSGWTAIVLAEGRPFRIRAIKREESVSLLVYIWNITSGGPETVRPAGELRIQITGVEPPLAVDRGSLTLLLGWHDELSVFAGYDVVRHRTFSRASPSLQVRQTTLENAAQRGMAAQHRTSQDIVVGFTPDQFMNYATHQAELHQFRTGVEFEVLQAATAGQDIPEEDVDALPAPRQPVIRTVQQWPRLRSFRIGVLAAYDGHCAICRIQLDLVEAAHIIPVGHPESNEMKCNGLALCPLHHDAYDDALLGVGDNYHIVANAARLDDLVARGIGTGADLFRTLHCSTILLPPSQPDRPRPAYLREGLRVRGWPADMWAAP